MRSLVVVLAFACSQPEIRVETGSDLAADSDLRMGDLGASDLKPASDLQPAPDLKEIAPDPLEVRFLGVGGFWLRLGDQTMLTAPLYTRPSMLEVSFGSIASDPSLVQANLPPLDHLRGIVSGHAHYDHLLDAPELLRLWPDARLYSNASAAHLLAALAPDTCGTPDPMPIERARVVAMDELADYRPCTGQGGAGTWVRIPGSRVRLYAICSQHPDQIGPYHFGPGSVDADQCTLPTVADEWREGSTLAFLIDFLDGCDRPIYRVYYQDAPTSVPIGLPPADVLLEKRVDLALLCVGNYDQVVDAPAATLAALQPRFALGGHWEDFFQPASDPPQPLPFHDLPGWIAKAQAALPSTVDPMWSASQRAILPQPGDRFTVPAATTSCP